MSVSRDEAIRGMTGVTREVMVGMLEGIAIQCYDHETDDELREAVIDSILCGDLELPA